MPAPSSERKHPEAWPASTYGHLRGVSLKIVPANKVLFAGTVPANNLFVLYWGGLGEKIKFFLRCLWHWECQGGMRILDRDT